MDDLIGRQLGNYKIIGLLGEGGMAAVYRAHQLNIERDVAIKVIKTGLKNMDEFSRRFEREAKTIASLNHPHIIKVFDYGQAGDMVYLVMELHSGGSLVNLMKRGPFSFEQTARFLDQIASALDYAHERSIIHRDLKPQNVLLDEKNNAILTDFGIAKVLGDSNQMTATGTTMGTPAYMAPEQWQGMPLDSRADIYALGIMAFEMLTGLTPFRGDTPFSMMTMHVTAPPPPLRNLRADASVAIENVLLRALAKDRNFRFSTGEEFAVAFRRALSGEMPMASGSASSFTATSPIPAGALSSTPPGIASPITPLGQQAAGATEVLRPKKGGSPLLLLVALAIIAVAIVAGIVLSGNRGGGTTTEGVTPTTAAAVAAQPTQTSPPTEGPTPTPSHTPNAETLVAIAKAEQVTATAQAISSFTKTPTVDQPATGRALLGMTETAQVVSSFTRTLTPTRTPSSTATNTRTFTATASRTPTATLTATLTATRTATKTATWTPSPVPATKVAVSSGPKLRDGDHFTVWAPEEYKPALDKALAVFQERFGYRVQIDVVPSGEMRDRLNAAIAAGSGMPDIIVGDSAWAGDLANQGLLIPVDLGDKSTLFTAQSRSIFNYHSALYGLPLSVTGVTLYYNKDLVPNPPETWAQMVQMAGKLMAEGKVELGIGIPPGSYFYYPLLRGFGSYVFRPSETGFDIGDIGIDNADGIRAAEALTALVERGLIKPGVDYSQMQDLFIQGKLPFWVNGPWALDAVRGSVNFGVASLPSINQPMRPIISGLGLMINAKRPYAEIANLFLREIIATDDFMPALYGASGLNVPSWRALFNNTLDPHIRAFAEALADGEPILTEPAFGNYWGPMDEAITAILNRTAEPAAIFRKAANQIRNNLGLATPPPEPTKVASSAGPKLRDGDHFTVWTTEEYKPVLDKALAVFQERFGYRVQIDIVPVNEMRDRFNTAIAAGSGMPDVLVGSSEWAGALATQGALAPVDLGDKSTLFTAQSRSIFNYHGALYGLPLYVNGVALYYNKDLVPNPPETWAQATQIAGTLTSQGKVELGIGIPPDPYHYYPFFRGFGSYVFAPGEGGFDIGNVGLDNTDGIRAAEALTALVERNIIRPGVDYSQMQELFSQGKLPFWVTGPWALPVLREAKVNFGVSRLPPVNQPMRPMISGYGLMINQKRPYAEIANLFLREIIATDDFMPALYGASGFNVPSWRALINNTLDPHIRAFTEALGDGEPILTEPALQHYWAPMQEAIDAILNRTAPPTAILRKAAEQIRQNVRATSPTPAPTKVAASDVPKLRDGDHFTVWTSEEYKPALDKAIAVFQERFGYRVQIELVPFGEMHDRFNTAIAAGLGMPDVLVGASDWAGDLATQGVLAPVDLAGKSSLFTTQSRSMFNYHGALYGLPLYVTGVALYYNKDLVPNPPETWAQMVQMAGNLMSRGKVELGIGIPPGGYFYYPFLRGFGSYVFRPSETGFDVGDVGIDNADGIRAAEALAALVSRGLIKPGVDYSQMQDLFIQGKLPFWVNGPWALSAVRGSVNFGVASLPPIDQPMRPMISGLGLMINAKRPYAEIANLFLREIIATDDVMPALESAIGLAAPSWRASDLDPDILAFALQYGAGEPITIETALQHYYGPMDEAIDAVLNRRSEPAAIFRNAANKIREAVRR